MTRETRRVQMTASAWFALVLDGLAAFGARSSACRTMAPEMLQGLDAVDLDVVGLACHVTPFVVWTTCAHIIASVIRHWQINLGPWHDENIATCLGMLPWAVLAAVTARALRSPDSLSLREGEQGLLSLASGDRLDLLTKLLGGQSVGGKVIDMGQPLLEAEGHRVLGVMAPLTAR